MKARAEQDQQPQRRRDQRRLRDSGQVGVSRVGRRRVPRARRTRSRPDCAFAHLRRTSLLPPGQRCEASRAVVPDPSDRRPNERYRAQILRSVLLVLLVVGAAALSACGNSSTSTSSSMSSTSSTAISTTAGSGSGVAAAGQKCLDATKKIQASSARSTAGKGVQSDHHEQREREHGAQQRQSTRASLRQRRSPVASLKQEAETQCNKITAP